jgi:predicted nucleic acid-binding protein
MRDKIFIDTNIFIYALTKQKDKKEIHKRENSIDLIKDCIAMKDIVVSTQIINELHLNSTTRLLCKIVNEGIK